MKERLTIVKVGGAIVEDSERLSQLLQDFASIKGQKILVHGADDVPLKLPKHSA